jgi:hypothetical protein
LAINLSFLSRNYEAGMKTRLTLKPGQHGTKALMRKYGDNLVCVRFRYDPVNKQRLKTVELVIERSDWTPPLAPFTNETLIPLRIAAGDLQVRNIAKSAGAKWNPEKKLWFVRYGKVAGTELEKYIDIDRSGSKT